MKTRIISGVAMLPLILVVLLGGVPLTIICFIIGIMGIREFYHAFSLSEVKPSYMIGILACILLYGINLLQIFGGIAQSQSYYMLWFFLVIVMSLLYLFDINNRKLEDSMVTITGIIYVVFFSFHVVLIDQLPNYSILIWLVFITAFVTDIMAYFSGYFFGKHKLCPNISPKKTMEGSIGGTLFSVMVSGIFGYFFCNPVWIHCLAIGLLGSIAGQLGDLTASVFKRKLGIKDYSNLIPGHGGILDRFDSVLFTAPVVYYYALLVL